MPDVRNFVVFKNLGVAEPIGGRGKALGEAGKGESVATGKIIHRAKLKKGKISMAQWFDEKTPPPDSAKIGVRWLCPARWEVWTENGGEGGGEEANAGGGEESIILRKSGFSGGLLSSGLRMDP